MHGVVPVIGDLPVLDYPDNGLPTRMDVHMLDRHSLLALRAVPAEGAASPVQRALMAAIRHQEPIKRSYSSWLPTQTQMKSAPSSTASAR